MSAASPSVMASGVTGSVSVALHPLVILNISDHWIRIRSQEGRPMQGSYDIFFKSIRCKQNAGSRLFCFLEIGVLNNVKC